MYQVEIKDNVLKGAVGIEASQTGEHAYELHLENGVYHVRVYAGDENYEGDECVYTNINGADYPPVLLQHHTVVQAVFDTQVTDGVLRIGFCGEYVRIQGLDIASKCLDVPQKLEEKHCAALERSSVVIGWTCPGDSFYLYKQLLDAPDMPVQRIPVVGHAYFDDEVELCRRYQYQVATKDAYGFAGDLSEPIALQIVESSKFKLYPFNFRIQEITETAVQLAWDYEEGIRCYVLYRRLGDEPWEEIGRVDGKTTSFTDNVVNGKQYTYALETESLGGISNKTIVSVAERNY
jgi:hypothetical protein